MNSAAAQRLDPADNVVIALRAIGEGDSVETDGGSVVVALAQIPPGHKMAIAPIAAGTPVVKYGHVIGLATTDIRVGEHVHSHNLHFVALEPGSGSTHAPMQAAEVLEIPTRTTFRGIRRSNGAVATRNYLAVASTVNCSATVVRAIASRAESSGLLERYPGIDGVVALTHEQGCGHGGELGIQTLQRTMRGYLEHPNVGGVVLVGLGCEMNLMETLMDGIQLRPEVPVVRFSVQDAGGTKAAIERGRAALDEIAPQVAAVSREEVSVAELVVGLNCGGSDGWSSLTANPALGYASDLIVAQGGRTVLAETPEIYGAEDLLIQRAVNPAVGDALVERLRWWEQYTADAGGSMDNNPSPGNKDGGITTILEKSLGAVAKSGHAPLQAVYSFAEAVTARGLSFMDTPGYDPVSVTGLIAGGCTLVAFTTGRGSAIGTRPAPTLKLATNSETYRRMRDDMDINCGDIIDEQVSIPQKGREIYERILDVASGELTASEELGYGENEFVPWHLGAVT
jgi:altronate hydrolase